MSLIDTITIGLRTTEESCPSDSSTAVITLSNFSHRKMAVHGYIYNSANGGVGVIVSVTVHVD